MSYIITFSAGVIVGMLYTFACVCYIHRKSEDE